MERNINGSPLSRICYQDSTYMLEAMLPFVPINLKLPLAMLIKWNEFQRMLRVFQDIRLLKQYGLMEEGFSMQALQQQLSGCPNPGLADNMRQMTQMMQMMQTMQAMQAAQSMEPSRNPSDLSHIIDDIINNYSNDAYTENDSSAPAQPPPAEKAANTEEEYSEEKASEASYAKDSAENDFNVDDFIQEVFS